MFKLTSSKSLAISNICINFSTVFLASLVVPIFAGDFNLSKWPIVLSGIIATVSFSLLAIFFAEKGKL
ncbi:hypothetical protein A3E66_02135 [Candidatus Daviesbacteria bacterium RIFCSPHIGHO2_12_FULL_37_16]|uniref:Major facilitator superfamily (MFS) profile domain-containing protein n=1 Tax=Candidatus Daviesbacteria bacterium RIFCSPHIGHO2_12_FULL_37_16 TaxID=1797778 RepID=A0A1F5K7D1_9BACT|nr:MAG: hypothetical protein A3C99_03735 [Candidatus Daviesbacteria bacterium RIFCSPHIGHO2_02_FULL_37_9]OGE36708.1 MAG: hypothetical protein A3E66_02135 [Candidatus Daviesbacteria bacterium RIFCSPHIGHO2_12_FULL_37_16]